MKKDQKISKKKGIEAWAMPHSFTVMTVMKSIKGPREQKKKLKPVFIIHKWLQLAIFINVCV